MISEERSDLQSICAATCWRASGPAQQLLGGLMRVLFVGINYAPDLIGTAKYNTELCESLVADCHEVQVVTAPPYYPAWEVPRGYQSSFFRPQEINGVLVTRTPMYVPCKPSGTKRLLHHASFALTSAAPVLAKALSWRPHVMISVAPSLMSAAIVAFAAHHTGAKSWLHLQDFEVDAAFDLGLLRNRSLKVSMICIEKHILRSFDRVSTISPQMVYRLETKGIDPNKLCEVRNWVDTSVIIPRDRETRYRQELNLNGSHLLVGLYAGAMSNKQGLDLVIETARNLEQSHPHIHFILCGDGPDKLHLMDMALGQPNVHFLALQPNDRLSELLATADFHLIPQKAAATDLVLPSKLGGILSSNRPVIAMATLGTGLADEVKDVGLPVAPGDTYGLATAICQLNDDRALGRRLGDNARKRALERWDKRLIFDNWSRDLSLLACQPLEARSAKAA
jgi:colanic acid biosynthesis glycosyl transferase WcaI